MKILVLTGGESAEREVAIRSGEAVASALIDRGHAVAMLDTVRGADSVTFYNDKTAMLEQLYSTISVRNARAQIHPSVLRLCKEADCVFPALHGGSGEDGTLQAMLDSVSARYSGSGHLACAISMDKALTKTAYADASILTPGFTLYKKGQKSPPIPPCYPCVVKPCDGGSSIGVSFVFAPCGLDGALKKALAVSDTVMLERMVIGRELSVSVLENEPLAVTEIIPKRSFFDYESKYKSGGAEEITPAPLPRDIYDRAMRIAKNAHDALRMRNFSRTDIIFEEQTALLYALETNALPGMTETSILPQAAKHRGIGYGELCERMLL